MLLIRRIMNLFFRSNMEREIDAELKSHIEMRIESNLAEGMRPEEARRDARLRFGNPATMKERVTDVDALLVLDSIWSDIRYAFRQRRSVTRSRFPPRLRGALNAEGQKTKIPAHSRKGRAIRTGYLAC